MDLLNPKILRLPSRLVFTCNKPKSFAPRFNLHQTHLKPFHSTLLRKMATNNDDLQLSNLFDVKGKVALVTGGGSGIGLMATQALAVNGAKVYIVGRTEEKLQTVADTHGKGISGQIIPLTADITSKQDILRLAKEIESREKCLCILINNAGIQATGKITPAGETAEEFRDNLFHSEGQEVDNWTSEYKTNVAQLYFSTAAFLPLLSRATEHQKGYSGTVINITSISGIVLKSQGHFSYNASKAAANHLTKMLAAEISNKGIKIRINAIAPGVYPSEMTAGESKDNQKSELPKEKYGHLPSERPGNDRDMANAILFAATNQYLNGQIVAVDGGYLTKFGS